MSIWSELQDRSAGVVTRKEDEAIEKERIREQLEKERLINKFKDKVYYNDDEGYYIVDYPSRIKEDYGSYISPEYVTWFK